MFTKKFMGMLMALIAVVLLGACSPVAATPILTPTEAMPAIQNTKMALAASSTPTAASVRLPTSTIAPSATAQLVLTPTEAARDRILADIVSVTANGNDGAYTFAVEIRSPDTGCEQYANWWEVVTEDGELIYRRILGHSHVNEQPFTRSGGPVMIGPETVVIVRAHMYPTGYGGTAFRGTIFGHFEEIRLNADFAPNLEHMDPQPNGCAF